jgi:hypothetical protein
MPPALAAWPLLLCGPVLRRVEARSLSVFVALKYARTVRIALYDSAGGAGAPPPPLATGERTTVPVGAHLHVALAPTVSDLRIVHGSCREPHGEGQDVLAVVDSLIASNPTDALARPHQLFLTGDQIYADDVAEPLLRELTATGDLALGWDEPLPLPGATKLGREIPPRTRQAVVDAIPFSVDPPHAGAKPINAGTSFTVPAATIAIAPQALAAAATWLRLGHMAQDAEPPLGRILNTVTPLILPDEEVPRDGRRITRHYHYARWLNGGRHTWLARVTQPAAGEGSSGARFDFLDGGSA